ncbi:hypothetical protein SDC9_160906 [bioreactor metagenome]|uniref:Uncharacterized protein n=1 Tax=bioreactor metagenome TaxID=1076179 RepID=A0A645FME5_9ZZZZ
MLRSGKYESDVYLSKHVSKDAYEQDVFEKDLLISEKRKKERAISRLKNLYLFDDESISEKDYVVEKKSLSEEIKVIDERLEKIEKDSTSNFTISDDEFISKASYFIMTQKLTEKRYINFDAFVRSVDTKIIKEFVNSVIKKIVITDGKIASICFKNGLTHKFTYKLKE